MNGKISAHLYFVLLQKKRAYAGYGHWISWKSYESRARQLDGVDFGCQFDSAGACKRQQGKHGTTVQNCCQACASSGAYLMSIKPGTSWEYTRSWDSELGFWRPGKGCILPRERRSYPCLTYNCHPKGYHDGSAAFDPHTFMQNGNQKLIQIGLSS